jgi:hypothetical protein
MTSYAGLSCYTANLAAYLDGEMPDTGQWLAESVRLAVRTDLPDGELAFSHHAYPLDRLPDGTRLRYASAATAGQAETGLTIELERQGQVLVVVDNSRLPWSPAAGTGQAAPHWLLVTGRDSPAAGRPCGADSGVVVPPGQPSCQVRDAFSGLLPAGEQPPYAGPLPVEALLDAMRPPPRWSGAQQRRNTLAFGFPVPVPADGTWQWLRRSAADGEQVPTRPPDLPGTWLTDDDDVLPFLGALVAGQGEHAARYLDDLWSAAGHRAFRYRWRAGRPGLAETERDRLAAAAAAWGRLPVALRFAVESARRGQPRASLVTTMFAHLRDIEAGADNAARR